MRRVGARSSPWRLLLLLPLLALPAGAQVANRFTLQADSIGNGGAGGVGRYAIVESFGSPDVAPGLAPTAGGTTGLDGGFVAMVLTPAVEGREEAVHLQVTSEGPLVFNARTGLFEQRVKVRNTWFSSIGGVRVLVTDTNLPAGLTLYNAAEGAVDVPFVQHAATVAPAAEMEVILEFHATAVLPPGWKPVLQAVAYGGAAGTALDLNAAFAVKRFVPVTAGADRQYLLEFASQPGAKYVVLYGPAFNGPWKAAAGVITAASKTVVWLDSGPPKTDLDPKGTGSRFYQIMRLTPGGAQ